MRADEVYAILLKKIRSSGGEISPEQLQEAIKNYLQKNPISTNIKEERPQETTYALKPNVQAVWGEVTELNLTLEEELPDAVNIYPFWFTSGSTPTKVILPSTIALPQSEQDAVRNLKTYYPTTVIMVDGGDVDAGIEVEYAVKNKEKI